MAAHLASLAPEKRAVIEEARALVQRHIPKGYAEFMNWGVINWGIPLEEFSNTHNGQPLCYVGLGAKKSYNSLYLMGAVRELERQVHDAVLREAAHRRIQEGREAARHGEVLSPLQEADDLELTSVAKVIAMSTPKQYIAY